MDLIKSGPIARTTDERGKLILSITRRSGNNAVDLTRLVRASRQDLSKSGQNRPTAVTGNGIMFDGTSTTIGIWLTEPAPSGVLITGLTEFIDDNHVVSKFG